MIRVNGFLGDSPKLQFEGNGGLTSSNGEKLFLLYHQGGLQINEYFPSLMLSVDLLSGEYQSSFLDAEIGFPKSYAAKQQYRLWFLGFRLTFYVSAIHMNRLLCNHKRKPGLFYRLLRVIACSASRAVEQPNFK